MKLSDVFPGWAHRRARARAQLELLERTYDIADPRRAHRYPQLRGRGYSPDDVVSQAGTTPRDWARHQDENNDLAIAVLDTLVDQFYALEPTPNVTGSDGRPVDRVNRQLSELWEEVTESGSLAADHTPWSEYKRQIGRAFLRDGDVFVLPLRGNVDGLEHLSEIPYALHALEADYVPLWLNQPPRTVGGVVVNRFARPITYLMYKEHPGSGAIAGIRGVASRKQDFLELPADQVWQLKFSRRLGQVRGVTVLHGVQSRLIDLHDYEESERLAAKIAASFAAVITRPAQFGFAQTTVPSGASNVDIEAGQIMDFANPGETIETLNPSRPSAQITPFRAAMMRAVAGGSGTNASTISRDYDGSYSSQRQEMVEAKPAYDRLRRYWVAQFLSRVYRDVVSMGVLMRRIDSRGLTMRQLCQATYDGAVTPWIDPEKEVKADALAVENGFKSRHQVIRERYGRPRDVDAELELDDFTKPAEQLAAAPPPPPAPAPADEDRVQ